jgi:hypothetical protein
VVNDDVLYRFRLIFSLAEELGNVRAVCRTMGASGARPNSRHSGPSFQATDQAPRFAGTHDTASATCRQTGP